MANTIMNTSTNLDLKLPTCYTINHPDFANVSLSPEEPIYYEYPPALALSTLAYSILTAGGPFIVAASLSGRTVTLIDAQTIIDREVANPHIVYFTAVNEPTATLTPWAIPPGEGPLRAQFIFHYFHATVHEDPEHIFQVGLAFSSGSGVPQDDDAAAKYFEKAKDAGHHLPKEQLEKLADYLHAKGMKQIELGQQITKATSNKAKKRCRKHFSEGIAILEKAADAGSGKAAGFLSVHYSDPQSPHYNQAKADLYLATAIKLKDPQTLYEQAECCYRNKDPFMEKSDEERYKMTLTYLEDYFACPNVSGDETWAVAKLLQGTLCFFGHGVPRSIEAAIEHFETAQRKAPKNSETKIKTCYMLARAHLAMTDNRSKQNKTIDYIKIAERNCNDKNPLYHEIQFILGKCYSMGLGMSEPSDVEAFACFLRSVGEDPNQSLELAFPVATPDEDPWWRFEAHVAIGTFFRNGTIIKQSDEFAIFHYTKAMEKAPITRISEREREICQIHYQLGVCLIDEADRHEDEALKKRTYNSAVVHLKLAANERSVTNPPHTFNGSVHWGLPEAQIELGICHYYGTGLQCSDASASSQFLRAAAAEDPRALHWLGFFHYYGFAPFKESHLTAAIYFQKAWDLGYKGSGIWLAKISLEEDHDEFPISDTLKYLETNVSVDPSCTSYHHLKGIFYLKHGEDGKPQPEKAFKEFLAGMKEDCHSCLFEYGIMHLRGQRETILGNQLRSHGISPNETLGLLCLKKVALVGRLNPEFMIKALEELIEFHINASYTANTPEEAKARSDIGKQLREVRLRMMNALEKPDSD